MVFGVNSGGVGDGSLPATNQTLVDCECYNTLSALRMHVEAIKTGQ